MNEVELSESLVKELFQNWLPNIWFVPIDEQSSNIVRVVCDFWFMNCKKIRYILEEFGYGVDSSKEIDDYVRSSVDSVVGI